jgi:hypothetical protein
MPNFRCTRNDRYDESMMGHKNVAHRQGHYIVAGTPEDALMVMLRRFPDDDDGFVIQDWDNGTTHGNVVLPQPGYNKRGYFWKEDSSE